MKIRRILSGAAAASMAFSAVSIVSVVASADEVDVWSDAGLVMDASKLADAGINLSDYEGKIMTVTFSITANVGEKWKVADTVVKYGDDEKKEVIQLLTDYDGGDWVDNLEQNRIDNGSTYTYDIDVPVGGMFEVRYGNFVDEYVLNSVTLTCDGKDIASSDANGNITKLGNDETENDPNAGNTGAEVDIWSDAGEIMTKWTLGDAGVDIEALTGKKVTVKFDISAAIPENAKGWTTAQTVVKFDGGEEHTIHFCKELESDPGQGWVKDFKNQIIENNTTFSYEYTVTFDDMFDVRFGTSNDKAYTLESVTVSEVGGGEVATYKGGTITAKNPVGNTGDNTSSGNDDNTSSGSDSNTSSGNDDITSSGSDSNTSSGNDDNTSSGNDSNTGSGNDSNTSSGTNADPNAGNTGAELDIWSGAGEVMDKWSLADAGIDVAALEGKTLTVTYEISAAIPNDAKGWTSAQTVVKSDGTEKHTIHFCEELLSDEGQKWVKDFDNNIIKNNATFTYDMTTKMDDMFDVRFGTSNDKAFVLKSVTLKDGDKAVAVFANGKIMKPDDYKNVDTGIEGVGIFAGIAGLAACAVMVARKRK